MGCAKQKAAGDSDAPCFTMSSGRSTPVVSTVKMNVSCFCRMSMSPCGDDVTRPRRQGERRRGPMLLMYARAQVTDQCTEATRGRGFCT